MKGSSVKHSKSNITCTLAEMIDKDLLDCAIDEPTPYSGFIIGKRGKRLFWHYDPTPNGFYKIYPHYENGTIGRPIYVDATKTIITLINNPK